jgi:hypothetical protein
MEADKAIRGEISMKEIDGLDDRRKFQALAFLPLITVCATEVALVG